MSKNIDDLYKELGKTNKEITHLENRFLKDISEISRLIKSMDKKVNLILSKIQEFEIVLDEIGDEETENDDWDPYAENYEAEDHENYLVDVDDDDYSLEDDI